MDRTERFRGRLMAGDQVLIESLEGFLKSSLRKTGSVGEWSGYFDCPTEHIEALISGNRYRLVLIDGRSGSVVIRHKEGEDPLRHEISFHGTGTVRR